MELLVANSTRGDLRMAPSKYLQSPNEKHSGGFLHSQAISRRQEKPIMHLPIPVDLFINERKNAPVHSQFHFIRSIPLLDNIKHALLWDSLRPAGAEEGNQSHAKTPAPFLSISRARNLAKQYSFLLRDQQTDKLIELTDDVGMTDSQASNVHLVQESSHIILIRKELVSMTLMLNNGEACVLPSSEKSKLEEVDIGIGIIGELQPSEDLEDDEIHILRRDLQAEKPDASMNSSSSSSDDGSDTELEAADALKLPVSTPPKDLFAHSNSKTWMQIRPMSALKQAISQSRPVGALPEQNYSSQFKKQEASRQADIQVRPNSQSWATKALPKFEFAEKVAPMDPVRLAPGEEESPLILMKPRPGPKKTWGGLSRQSGQKVQLFERPDEFEARKRMARSRLKQAGPDKLAHGSVAAKAKPLGQASATPIQKLPKMPGLNPASKRIQKNKALPASKLNPIDLYNQCSETSVDLSSDHGTLPPKVMKFLREKQQASTADDDDVRITTRFQLEKVSQRKKPTLVKPQSSFSSDSLQLTQRAFQTLNNMKAEARSAPTKSPKLDPKKTAAPGNPPSQQLWSEPPKQRQVKLPAESTEASGLFRSSTSTASLRGGSRKAQESSPQRSSDGNFDSQKIIMTPTDFKVQSVKDYMDQFLPNKPTFKIFKTEEEVQDLLKKLSELHSRDAPADTLHNHSYHLNITPNYAHVKCSGQPYDAKECKFRYWFKYKSGPNGKRYDFSLYRLINSNHSLPLH